MGNDDLTDTGAEKFDKMEPYLDMFGSPFMFVIDSNNLALIQPDTSTCHQH